MSWTVYLQDERNCIVERLEGELLIDSFEMIIRNNDYHLIKYLDPYGDAIFNGAQMNDLMADVKKLLEREPNNQNLIKIMSMAQKCANEVHLYLFFGGD